MKAERLEREFAARGVPDSGSLLLLRPLDALALVRRASDEGVPILGVDGFYLTDEGTEAPLDHIADLSSGVTVDCGCWEAAEAFIRERGDLGMLFELTLGSDP
jgi:hypothetical protein